MSGSSNIDDNNIFKGRFEMAKLTYGSVLTRSKKYIKMTNERKSNSVLLLDRHALLCKKQIERLEFEEKTQFYGPYGHDVMLTTIKDDLKCVLNQLINAKKSLVERGFENSMLKLLPECKRFTCIE